MTFMAQRCLIRSRSSCAGRTAALMLVCSSFSSASAASFSSSSLPSLSSSFLPSSSSSLSSSCFSHHHRHRRRSHQQPCRSFSAAASSDSAEAADFSLPVNTSVSDLFSEPFSLVPKPPKPPLGVGKLVGEYRSVIGKEVQKQMLSYHQRIPAVITGFRDTRKRILLSFDQYALNSVLKEGQIYNRVFEISLPDFQTPIKCIIHKVNYHMATDAVLNVELTEFIPGQKNRITMPVKIKDIDDSIGIKKGGVLVLAYDSVPMWWTGDENIPAAIEVSLLNARLNTVQRLSDMRAQLSPLLGPVHSHVDYVFSSIRGSRRADADDDAAEKAAADKAAADKAVAAKATAAAGTAKAAAMPAAGEKKDEAKKDDAKKK